MARRSDHSRDQLSALVVAAAIALAEQGGLRAVTMREIAGRIGYAPGSIYNAVGDLDTVLLRVKAAALVRLGERLAQVVAGGGDPMRTALDVADAYIRFVTEQRRLWTVMLEQRLPADGAPQWLLAALLRPVEIVDGVLAPFFADPAACRNATTALWAALEGVASLAVSGALHVPGGDTDPAGLARSIVHRFLTGTEASSAALSGSATEIR